MKLIILLSTFILLSGVSFLIEHQIAFALAGRGALSAMLIFTGVVHLVYKDGVALTYPDFLSEVFRYRLVLAIADLNFAFAAGFLISEIAKIITVLVLLYFILSIIPEIKACIHTISIKRGNFTGNGPLYLLIKIPVKLILLVWTYYFGLVI